MPIKLIDGPATLGADPELFLYRGEDFYNAHNSFGTDTFGTKYNPEPTSFGAIQIDGMAVEYNIRPASTRDEFIAFIQAGLDFIPNKFHASISQKSLVEFTPAFLQAQHPLSTELGCEPDYNGWTGDINERPDEELPMRTAGGHVHVGYLADTGQEGDDVFEFACGMARQLDYFLGLWSMSIDKEGERRRALYGNPGAFRPKLYGMEYRVLSNFWIYKPELTGQVYDRTQAALHAYRNGFDATAKWGDQARKIMQAGDVAAAAELDALIDAETGGYRAA